MKKTVNFSKGVEIHITSRPKAFNHPASIKIEFSYEDAHDRTRDQDELEEHMMEIAGVLRALLSAYGEVEVPPKLQFEGSIDMRAKLDDDADLDSVLKKLSYTISSLSARADGAHAAHRDAVQHGRLNSVTSALRDFMGTAIDDTNIESIARRVLERLKLQNRGNGLL